jgi:periplasmic protein TonB
MSDSTPTGRPVATNTAPGHLSVHLEEAHPQDIPFLFERYDKRMSQAFVVSFACHAAMVVMMMVAIRYGASGASTEASLPRESISGLVWLNEPGPGGGGGGGGNRMPDPPRLAELPGKDKLTVPVMKAAKLENPQTAKDEPDPLERLNIPARTLAAGVESLVGAIDGPPGPSTLSLGSGSGGGAGTGAGSGIGPGTGSGLGPGSGGGTGGGVYRPGSGVTLPRVLREVKPQYTSDAMRAKVQGTVLLECVVLPDGRVGQVEIVRSLDSTFGLDQEAIKAVRQWQFVPGTRMGEAVSVLVTVEMTFALR